MEVYETAFFIYFLQGNSVNHIACQNIELNINDTNALKHLQLRQPHNVTAAPYKISTINKAISSRIILFVLFLCHRRICEPF